MAQIVTYTVATGDSETLISKPSLSLGSMLVLMASRLSFDRRCEIYMYIANRRYSSAPLRTDNRPLAVDYWQTVR